MAPCLAELAPRGKPSGRSCLEMGASQRRDPLCHSRFSSDRIVRCSGGMDRIELNPEICNGRPVVKGTRIAVQTVMEFLGAGDSIEDILDEYPSLRREDVLACIEWGGRLMANHYQVEALR